MALLSHAAPSYCDILIIINPNNPTTELTKEAVKNIFLGRLTRFPDSDLRVSPIEIKQDNPQKHRFYKIIANKSVNKINRYWARYLFTGKMSPPKKLLSNQEIIDEIMNNPSGVSYIDSKDVTSSVKVVLTLQEE